ncbi:MAG: FadR family transcriptional regulator [Candidatus Hydrogenedentes bacterium]|nr:FadR family transcriptional regulator [Candidatus Hydrogenedentota bacterium]
MESTKPVEHQKPLALGHTVSKDITKVLIRRIVEEDYPPHTKLPTERALAQEFGVARHVVREALKRIEALGLVRIRQGSGIQVEPLPLTGGVELLQVLLTREDGAIDFGFLDDLQEFRDQSSRAIVRLAAMRRTEEELAQLRRVITARREALEDARRLNELNAELFHIVAKATHNRVYQLIVNTLGRIFLQFREGHDLPSQIKLRVQEVLENLLTAFEARDGDAAERTMFDHGQIFDGFGRRDSRSASDEKLDEPAAAPEDAPGQTS